MLRELFFYIIDFCSFFFLSLEVIHFTLNYSLPSDEFTAMLPSEIVRSTIDHDSFCELVFKRVSV